MSIWHWQRLNEEVHILSPTPDILLRCTRAQRLSNNFIVLQCELELPLGALFSLF